MTSFGFSSVLGEGLGNTNDWVGELVLTAGAAEEVRLRYISSVSSRSIL